MDKNEFADRVTACEDMLYRISMSMLKNTADCEDAVQQTVFTAFGKLNTLKNEEYFKTWLVRILINECRLTLRRRKRTAPLELIECGQYDSTQTTLEVRQALDRLSPKYRVVLVMKYSEGFSIKEIARALSLPEGTVKSRLSEGRKALSKELGSGENTAPAAAERAMC